MHHGVIRVWITASLLALSACATPPASDSPVVPALPTTAATPRPASQAAAPATSATPAASTTPVAGEATPLTVPPGDETALLAGEMPREFQRGKASWYGPRFNGRRTASGERYDMHALTAAHRSLPFGTLVRVRSLVNGKEVDVRITDRGPFGRGRVIDLSQAAAEAVDMRGLGVKDVLLLVPDSTPPLAEPPPPVQKPRVVRRAPKPR